MNVRGPAITALVAATTFGLLAAACPSGGSVSAGTPRVRFSSEHQGIEVGAHKDVRPDASASPDEERPVEPERPLGISPAEQTFVHVHAVSTTCSGVLVGSRLVFTSRRCTGPGRGARGHEGELRAQIPAGALSWTQRKVEAWVAPSCDRATLDAAVLVLVETAEAKPAVISSLPGVGTKVRSPGYGTCGDVGPGMRAGSIVASNALTFRIDASLCGSDVGAPVLDSSGNAIGLVVRAGHEEGTPAHDDPEHERRHSADAVRLDGTPLRGLLERARRVEAGEAAAVEAATPCE